ncbi:hypothetical protein [Leucobacter triazinivorans]|uniref:Uncharacterized protein n=1 Tax=Leucobacter triazinivorans TaxID=1784719 RepID=A0A4P6KG48_9MICO|nr:hypothetical protein [Leucobacter triazinivorans]QBE48444.1 hypothetical protein EVS81_05980 [Leucobacter triazinivorans]
MNAGEIVIAAVGALGGVGGAVFAWVQAKAAVGSRDDAKAAQEDAELAQRRAEAARDEALELARKATAAAERQAAAQEEANRLEIEARTPPAWSGPEYVSEKVRAMVNTSGASIEVISIEVVPETVGGFVQVQDGQAPPYEVPEGGSLRYYQIRAYGPGADLIAVQWRNVGTTESRELRIPLI